MLKNAICFNALILLIISTFLSIKTFDKNANQKTLKWSIITNIAYVFVGFLLLYIGLVDMGWNLIYVYLILTASLLPHILSIYRIGSKKSKFSAPSSKIYPLVLLIPALIFVIPYLYESYVINNCEYLLKYNYQHDTIRSIDTHVAIINNKPVPITLRQNLFERTGESIRVPRYYVAYGDNIEVFAEDASHNKTAIENDDVKNIALGAKEKCAAATDAIIRHLPEKNYYIITLSSDEKPSIEYFYYDSTYIKITSHGNFWSAVYYR